MTFKASLAIERTQNLLNEFAKKFPNAWAAVDHLRAQKASGQLDWPSWCFLPLASSCDIVRDTHYGHFEMPGDLIDASILGALAAWRVSKGVFRFDPTVFDALIDTPLTGDLPSEILYRLPQWGIFLETPGLRLDGYPVHGAFAHLEFNPHHPARPELRLILDHDHPNASFKLASIFLGNWSLVEALDRSFRPTKAIEHLSDDAGQAVSTTMVNVFKPVVEPIVSLLLYLCSVSADYGDNSARPGNPMPRKTKKGIRLFAPHQAEKWEVGVRLGAALRSTQNNSSTSATGLGTNERGHHSPKPHVRRAHWHGFWTGPKESERAFEIRWLPPIPVNVADFDHLPTTVRAVEK